VVNCIVSFALRTWRTLIHKQNGEKKLQSFEPTNGREATHSSLWCDLPPHSWSYEPTAASTLDQGGGTRRFWLCPPVWNDATKKSL